MPIGNSPEKLLCVGKVIVRLLPASHRRLQSKQQVVQLEFLQANSLLAELYANATCRAILSIFLTEKGHYIVAF